jgi:uncharacterized membrane protein YqaE (UPF0057 family)
MSKRVRIFFIGCPSLDLGAASHLLLSQNSVQKEVQFEIYHFWIYAASTNNWPRNWVEKLREWYGNSGLPLSSWVDRRNRASLDYREAPIFKRGLSVDGWFNACQSAVSSYDAWFKQKGRLYDVIECPSIIITEAPIDGGFISFTRGEIGLISTANWRKMFKPVSALDYILMSVQRLTVRLAFSNQIGSHYPTRGCLWDFDHHQPDARISILSGYICETCRMKLVEAVGEPSYAQLEALIGNTWLGNKTDQYLTASVLAHVYKYDLSRSTGLSASFVRRVMDSLAPEAGKVILEGIKWAFVLTLTLTITAYFPSLLKQIRTQLEVSSGKK